MVQGKRLSIFLRQPAAGEFRAVARILCRFGLSVIVVGAILLSAAAVPALQPAYIKGSIFSAFDNAIVYNAVIKTSSGILSRAPSGTFSLRLPPGVYTLLCEAPGYTANILGGVRATPGQTALVTLWLVPAGTPTCTLRGRLLDGSSFNAIARGLVTVDVGGAALSDDDGYFSMLVPSGTAVITAGAQGYATKTARPVALRAGRVERVVIYLKKKHADTVTVTGLVKNACTSEKIGTGSITSFSAATAVARNGTYELAIETGPTTMLATAPGYQYAVRTGSFRNVLLPPVANISLLPSKNGFGSVRGTVLGSEDGLPCDNAKIVSNTGAVGYTDAAGDFQIYTSVCTTSITVSHEQFVQKQFPVTVNSGTVTTVSLTLDPVAEASSPSIAGGPYRPAERCVVVPDDPLQLWMLEEE